jgi:hypothetical protein
VINVEADEENAWKIRLAERSVAISIELLPRKKETGARTAACLNPMMATNRQGTIFGQPYLTTLSLWWQVLMLLLNSINGMKAIVVISRWVYRNKYQTSISRITNGL